VKQALNLRWIARPTTVEYEVVDVECQKLQLCFEIVSEADDARSTMRMPLRCNALKFLRVEVAAVKLRCDEGVQSVGDVILKLTVQETLLTSIQ
jgi:hypothetical protein